MGLVFAIRAMEYPLKFFGYAYASILETFCPASNTSFTLAEELAFALHEMELITGLPVSRDLYEEYIPPEEEFKQLKVKDREFYYLLVALFDLHIHEKMVYHKHWLNRRPHPVLWELFERSLFRPWTSSLLSNRWRG